MHGSALDYGHEHKNSYIKLGKGEYGSPSNNLDYFISFNGKVRSVFSP